MWKKVNNQVRKNKNTGNENAQESEILHIRTSGQSRTEITAENSRNEDLPEWKAMKGEGVEAVRRGVHRSIRTGPNFN